MTCAKQGGVTEFAGISRRVLHNQPPLRLPLHDLLAHPLLRLGIRIRKINIRTLHKLAIAVPILIWQRNDAFPKLQIMPILRPQPVLILFRSFHLNFLDTRLRARTQPHLISGLVLGVKNRKSNLMLLPLIIKKYILNRFLLLFLVWITSGRRTLNLLYLRQNIQISDPIHANFPLDTAFFIDENVFVLEYTVRHLKRRLTLPDMPFSPNQLTIVILPFSELPGRADDGQRLPEASFIVNLECDSKAIIFDIRLLIISLLCLLKLIGIRDFPLIWKYFLQ